MYSKLNLGCGNDYLEGWLNIDISVKSKADLVYDLSKGIPLADNSVIQIKAQHFLEHIQDIIYMMNEIWRVCINGAKVYIEVPHQSSLMAFADPTHKRIFNEESFKYFYSGGDHYWIHDIYGIICDFKLVKQNVTKDPRHGIIQIWFEAKK